MDMTGERTPLTCATCARAIVASQVAIFREGRAFHLPCYRHTGVLTIVAARGRRGRAPRGHGDPARSRTHPARPARSDGPPAPARDRPLAGARILVVEGDPEHRDRLAAFLQRAGAAVASAPAAEGALAALAAHPPDVVIAALAPPADDGLTVLRRIRALDPERGGRVPVLAVTPAADADTCHRVGAAGFTACLAKPLDWDQLLDVLRRTLGRAAP
jgi:CheY-like chemotaxis protein